MLADDPTRARRTTLSPDAAFGQIEEWLHAPRAWIPEPSDRYGPVLGALVRNYRVRGPLVTDAQVAALAIDHGVSLVSTDSDFARFGEVTWIDPLGAA